MKNDNTILILGLGALAIGGFYLMNQRNNSNNNTNTAPGNLPANYIPPTYNPPTYNPPISTGGSGFNSGFGTQQSVANGWNFAAGLAGAAGDIISAFIKR